MTTIYGSNFADTLTFDNWSYAWDTLRMGDGNDTVIVPGNANTAFMFVGESGNDVFQGGRRTDNALGGTGNDTLDGSGGDDFLSGDAGQDRLIGGTGADWLKGGEGTDTFVFGRGESAADTILDWDVRADYIDSTIAGTSANYAEAMSSVQDISMAKYLVESSTDLKMKDHVFLYNTRTDTGYLMSDLDHNHTFETGVVIKGAGSAADMNWSDIV